MDVIGTFVKTCCNLYEEAKTQSLELYLVWVEWCKLNGVIAGSHMTFAKRLEKAFEKNPTFQRRKGMPVFYYGIALNDEWSMRIKK